MDCQKVCTCRLTDTGGCALDFAVLRVPPLPGQMFSLKVTKSKVRFDVNERLELFY